jgi:hypothetical protein
MDSKEKERIVKKLKRIKRTMKKDGVEYGSIKKIRRKIKNLEGR